MGEKVRNVAKFCQGATHPSNSNTETWSTWDNYENVLIGIADDLRRNILNRSETLLEYPYQTGCQSKDSGGKRHYWAIELDEEENRKANSAYYR